MKFGKLFWIVASLAACSALAAGQDFSPPAAPSHGGSFLGVGVAAIDNGRADALKLPIREGVEITRVEEDSPAEKAGLKTGDVVLRFNGQTIGGVEAFIRLVHQTPPGHHVKLLVGRAGETRTLNVVLGSRMDAGMPMPPVAPMPTVTPNIDLPAMPGDMRQSVLGVEVEELSPQLAAYFGVRYGVLVRTVVAGTPAARAGFHAGDVITKVNGAPVEHASDVFIAVHSRRSSRILSVRVVRDHREIGLSPAVPNDGEQDAPQPDRR